MNIELALLLGAFAIIGVLAALLLLVYHKLSSGTSALKQQITQATDNTFAQVEALSALYGELKLDQSLPPTRGWAASPDFLRNIMVHARGARPGTVVECSSGISTIVLARCAQLNGTGHVFSLEHAPEFAEKTRALLKRHGLQEFATVVDAPLRALTLPDWKGNWYSTDALPSDLSIDLLVIDGPPTSTADLARYPAIPVLHKQLNAGGAIFLDDAIRPEEQQAVTRWQREHQDLVSIFVAPCEKGCVMLKKSAA